MDRRGSRVTREKEREGGGGTRRKQRKRVKKSKGEKERESECIGRQSYRSIKLTTHPPTSNTSRTNPNMSDNNARPLDQMLPSLYRRSPELRVYIVLALNSLALFTSTVHNSSEFSLLFPALLLSPRYSTLFLTSSSNLPDTEFLNLEATLLPPSLITSI